ncbi:hypothetical protein GUJ93_ZPchr0405g2937 [Zizania palustris]|uniref:Uncharacterized protein n=1 Tax=Zizania palustris TaxID=103762 RepID=A0A8J5QTP1_ZIZPA|nr:hypothetical protein GUJ93_ZPchr0405g2937 [Zizania palustris]
MALNLVLHCIQPCKRRARSAYVYEGWANPSHEFPEALAMKEAYFSNEDAPKSYRLVNPQLEADFDNCGVGAKALLKMVDDEPSCAVM